MCLRDHVCLCVPCVDLSVCLPVCLCLIVWGLLVVEVTCLFVCLGQALKMELRLALSFPGSRG